MNQLCEFDLLPGTAADYRCRRADCLRVVRNVASLPLRARCLSGQPHPPTPVQPAKHHVRPGQILHDLLVSIGLTEHTGCQCHSLARKMDAWGIEGCREHFEEIVVALQESYDNLGWADKVKAAATATITGLAFHLDPRDPVRSSIELAIARAEQKEAQSNFSG